MICESSGQKHTVDSHALGARLAVLQRLSPPESSCPSTLAINAVLFIHSVSVVRCFHPRATTVCLGSSELVLRPCVLCCCSEVVLQFEDAVGQRGVQVRVGHLLDTEVVQHLVVGGRLHALELFNADLAVVNRDEVDELLVLVDVDVKLLDRGRVCVDILLDGRLRLEEALEGRLSKSHLLELGLLLPLLLLGLRLQELLVGATTHGGHHGLQVQKFATN